ncbi:MAG: L-aspartate oxidase [Phycisphaerales bacterium]|jgi:L-aspartate oxidase|nr:L-aspartate oxidase [Phycisphaerales bacterium]
MDGLFDQRRYLIPFRSRLLPQIFTDTLVIGAGVAGLRAAIAAGEHGEVIVLAKGTLEQSNTAWAQGGIAAARAGDEHDIEGHVRDTLIAGAGLCDEGIVRLVVEHGPERMEEMLAWGMRVDRDASGRPRRGMEGGHELARILHAGGDQTGAELQRCLGETARARASVRIFERCFALDLITPSPEPGSPVLGAITHHPKYGLQMVWARATILATGGAGVVFRETTNPPVATADGIAMAYRAGATLADMAFVQFHPTTLYVPGAQRALISEAVRGEGAVLLDAAGHRFMPEVHAQADLAPRDIVSRAIVKQIARQGGRHVWLDCRGIAGFAERFPSIARTLAAFDLDPSRDLIPVHPAAHYTIGGVRTHADGRTDVPGLLAVGEAAASGLHGANRLASNSLLEGLVLGEIAGHVAGSARTLGGDNGPRPASVVSDIPPSTHGEIDLSDVRSSVRSAMWRNVGLVRTGEKLRDAMDMFDFWARYTLDKVFDDPAGWETQNMLLAAALIARSAAWREESRGCHWRSDFESPVDQFRAHDAWRRGEHDPSVEPVHGTDGEVVVRQGEPARTG